MKKIMSDFDQIKYTNEFNKKKYDRITLIVPKGQKEVLKEYAKIKGVSLNEFITSLIRKELNDKTAF